MIRPRKSPNAAGTVEQPLQGKRIVVTRSPQQAPELSLKLRAVGAESLELPLIRIQPCFDPETSQDVFAEIAHYDWLVFTSFNGVKYFFEQFFKHFEDIRSLGFIRIAAVGKGTAKAIHTHHLKVDLIPEEATSEALGEALCQEQSLDSVKILIVTGNLNRDVLEKKLNEAAAIVDTFPVYETLKTDLSGDSVADSFRKNGADAVTFTSPSTVKSFVDQASHLQLEKTARRPLTCSIGPVTSEAMRKIGMTVDIEAEEHTLDGMVQALVKKFTDSKKS